MTRLRVEELLYEAAAAHGEGIALVAGGRRLTYAALARDAGRLAESLRHRGVSPGDRVAVFLPNSAEMVVAFWAILRAGAVFMPIGAQSKESRLTRLLADAAPRCLLAHASLSSEWMAPARGVPGLITVVVGALEPGPPDTLRFEQLLAERTPAEPRLEAPCSPDDLALLLYTSGSTGDPKGVMLSHRNVTTATTSIQSYLDLQASDVLLCALPLSFGYGLTQLLLAAQCRARVVLASFAFPVTVLETLHGEGATVFAGVPTMFATLLAQSQLASTPLPALRLLTSAGSALSAPQTGRILSAFPGARLFAMYGQTECLRITYLPPEELSRRPTSVGRGMPGQDAWLEDESGERLPAGACGELVVEGPHVMQGYWGRPDASAGVLRAGSRPGTRVLRTRDMFTSDADGFLYFVSRTDDIIKTRGEKVAPRTVEDTLLELPAVREAVVAGVEDPLLGQAVKAFVVLEDGANVSDRDLIRHCQSRLENYMAPKYIERLLELPRTSNGKVDRRRLVQGK